MLRRGFIGGLLLGVLLAASAIVGQWAYTEWREWRAVHGWVVRKMLAEREQLMKSKPSPVPAEVKPATP